MATLHVEVTMVFLKFLNLKQTSLISIMQLIPKTTCQ